MTRNDPRRNLIQTWHWGTSVDIYTDPKKAPRWIRNRGLHMSPCDVAGCKQFTDKGAWYVRHPFLGIVCEPCAAQFGAYRPTPREA